MSAKSLILAAFAAALAVTATPAFGKDGDLLDQTKRSTSLAAQKTEAEVRTAVVEAQRLFASDRGKAIDKLKQVLIRLDDDTTLADSRRDALKRMLKDRIRVFETDTAQVKEKDTQRVEKKAVDTERRADQDRRAAEDKIIQRNIDTVRQLLQDGRTEDARRVANELARRYPGNPEVLALFRSMSVTDQRSADRRTKNDYDRRRADALRDVDRSAMLPKGDIEFDAKYWRDVVSKRKPAVRLTPKEDALLKALALPLRVNFKDSRFQEVMETLQTMLGQPILVDEESMKIAQVTYDTQVSLPLRSAVAARTVLRKILQDLGLTYVIKDEVIQVMTPEKAKNLMITRTYPIADLVGGGQFGFLFGPGAQAFEIKQRSKMIMDMITSTVDPPSWRVNGNDGQGTIAFDPASMSLIIRNSAEVHSMLGSSFR